MSFEFTGKIVRDLKQNLNRIDLLTDAKIADIKGLMKVMNEQILKLSDRILHTEEELYKK